MTAAPSPLTVIFDGSLPASSEEVTLLKSKDTNALITLVDISSADVNPSDYGCKVEDVRKSIHVRDASGNSLTGIAALEAAFEAVGLGSYFRFARMPGMVNGDINFRR